MQVEIVSFQAVLAGDRPSIVWVGDVPELDEWQHELGEDETDAINSYLFRYFNRVDIGDGNRLERIGYRLPSMSVGDLLHWGSKTYRVAGSGFECIDADNLAVALAMYTARTLSGSEGVR